MVIREVRDGVLYSCWAAILQLKQGLRNLNVLNLYVGATPHQSKINLIGWLDTIVWVHHGKSNGVKTLALAP